jgi:hypothetical protein
MKEWTRWDAIKWFYREHEAAILNGPRNEWAMDPCAWLPVIQLTPIEQWLWGDIRDANAVFYPQWPVAGVFVDFANPAAKVAIECDGAAYHQDKEKDAARDARLEALGWTVFRISGSGCRADCDSETGEPGYGRRFIDAIASEYGLKRTGKGRRLDGYDCAVSVVNTLMERAGV